MATEILHSRDLLVERFHAQPSLLHRRRNFPANGNVTSLAVNRRHHHHHHHHNRRVSPQFEKNRFSPSSAEAKRSSHGGAGLVMGQVTLLRRGEPLASRSSPITPNETVQNCQLSQIRLLAAPPPDVYAGSAFSLSPSPRSVPLPSFFNKKEPELFEDGATRDLRRILRLEWSIPNFWTGG